METIGFIYTVFTNNCFFSSLYVPCDCICSFGSKQLLSAKEAIKEVLDHLTNPQTETHLLLEKGGDAILILLSILNILLPLLTYI